MYIGLYKTPNKALSCLDLPCVVYVGEFVVGSLLCSERFFSGYSGFPLSSTTNTFKFQFEMKRTGTFQRVLKNSLVLRLVGKQIIKKIYNFQDS